MVGMPYHLEKGPWLSVFEDYLNSDQDRTYSYLKALRASRSGNLSDMNESLIHRIGLNNDKDPFSKDVPSRKRHLNEHWYGLHQDEEGQCRSDFQVGFVASTMAKLPKPVQRSLKGAGLVPTSDPDREDVEQFAAAVSAALEAYDYQLDDEIFHSWPTTGFWFQYFGDVQSIMRETLIRAIEVSLGLSGVGDDGADLDRKPDRHIPIEMFWKCPQRWFEGWVSWRADAKSGTGQVTMMLATPGHGKPVLESPIAGWNHVLNPSSDWTPTGDLPVTPPPAPGALDDLAPKGMWVITHTDHAQMPTTPDEGATSSGRWTVPAFGPSYVGVGEIVTVAPSERDGGVRPQGRRADRDTTAKAKAAENGTKPKQIQEVR